MKQALNIILLCLFFISCTKEKLKEDAPEKSTLPWTKEKKAILLANRQDTMTWDLSLLKNDLDYFVQYPSKLPFERSTFPVPKYNLLGEGSFKGMGNYGSKKSIADKTLLYNSFFVGKNEINKTHLGDLNNEVFFHIIVLTNYIDTINYSHFSSSVVSRNHPDFIGQGFYKTIENKITYSAFITAERNAYAIVNMRLFDLEDGKTILIAPQKDMSLRSMQIKSPDLSNKGIDTYTDELLKDEEVIQFFTKKGNI